MLSMFLVHDNHDTTMKQPWSDSDTTANDNKDVAVRAYQQGRKRRPSSNHMIKQHNSKKQSSTMIFSISFVI